MKAIVGFTFFLLFLAGFAFVAMQGARQMTPDGDSTQAALTAAAWRPLSIGAEPIPADTVMIVRFEDDGKLSGHAGCNRFFGSYALTDGRLEIGPLGMTKMACPEPAMSRETAFVGALEEARRFAVILGGLTLQGDDGQVLAQLAAADAGDPD